MNMRSMSVLAIWKGKLLFIKDHISIDIKFTLNGKTLVPFMTWSIPKKNARNRFRNKLARIVKHYTWKTKTSKDTKEGVI